MKNLGLLDGLIAKLKKQELTPDESSQLAQAVEQLENEGKPNAQVYVEHNGETPFADVAMQCQCASCNAYRAENTK